MRPEYISSAQNAKIKMLLELQDKSKARRKAGLFVVEGVREIERCAAAGYEIDTVFYCPSIYGKMLSDGAYAKADGAKAEPTGLEPLSPIGNGKTLPASLAAGVEEPKPLCAHARSGRGPAQPGGIGAAVGLRLSTPADMLASGKTRVIEISEEIYNKVAYRGGTEGMIAEVKIKENSLDSLQLPENPLIVVLESVEKPGNLGAVLRSADAAGVHAVLVCDPLTDLWNPNLIRSSLGGFFTVPSVACSSQDAIAFLKKKGVKILTAQLQDSEWYYDTDMTCGTAIVIGTEATGLTDTWRDAADAHIKIPMLGMLDSLNASVSAAILMFEAVRQRHSSR